MAGRRKTLSPAQQSSLNEVRDTGRAYKRGRAETEARIRQLVKDENNALELAHALAVRRSYGLDVPISVIGVEGMGTSDRNTVHRWLKKTERLAQVTAPAEGTPTTVFEWEDRAAGLVRVRYPSFPTTAVDADYPEVLEGVARRDPSSPTGWRPVEDPGTVETPMGDLRGWLSVELEDVPNAPHTLTGMLDEWVSA